MRLGRTVGREIAWIAVYIFLAIAATWPLARLLDRAVSDPGDPLLNTWILHWDWFASFSRHSLFHANIFHPARWSLAFSENLYGIAIFAFPLRFAGLSPLAAYNIAMIAGFALSGYGAHLFARTLLSRTTRGWSLELMAFLAGVYFALTPYRFDQLSHLQHVWAGWIPITLAALVMVLRRPGWRSGALFVGAYFMNGITNIHWLLFIAVTVPIVGLALTAIEGIHRRRVWLTAAAAFMVANALLVPMLIPYKIASEEYGMVRTVDGVEVYSATAGEWLVGSANSRTWGDLNSAIRHDERALFPGALVLLLTGVALIGRSREYAGTSPGPPEKRESNRYIGFANIALIISGLGVIAGLLHSSRSHPQTTLFLDSVPLTIFVLAALVRLWFRYPRWIASDGSIRSSIERADRDPALWVAMTLIVLGFAGSLGLNGPFHSALFSVLEPFHSLRVPARWAMIAYCGLSLTAAVGLGVVLRWSAGWKRIALAILVPLLMLAELWNAPIRWWIEPVRQGEVYEWLRTAPITGGVLELPIGDYHEYQYVRASTVHNLPIMNGISGFSTPLHDALVANFNSSPVPSDAMIDLKENDASIVVVHNEGRRTSDAVRAWLQEGLADGSLIYLRRFPHEFGWDYVFAVAANEPLAVAMAFERPIDPLGRSEQDNLRIFLESNGNTWVDGTIGFIDWPGAGDEAYGRARVHGWAMSPYGINRVDVLLENEKLRFPAKLRPYPTVAARQPGYPEQTPSFEVKFDNRPDGVSFNTDVIVEIVDGRGRVSRFDQRMLQWSHRPEGLPAGVTQWDRKALEALLVRMGYEAQESSRVLSGEVEIEALVIGRLDAVKDLNDQAFLREVYPILLLRDADDAAIDLYTRRMRAGMTREDVIRKTVRSKEFVSRYSAKK